MSFIILKYLREMIDDTRGHLIQFLGLTQRRRKHLNFSEDFIVSDNEKNDSIDIRTVPIGPLIGFQGFRGTQGFQGFQGAAGIDGVIGIDGARGIQGPQGAQGTRGISGIFGSVGFKGTQGIQGFQGPIGCIGNLGFQGIKGPTISHNSLQGLYGGSETERYHISSDMHNILCYAPDYTLLGNPYFIVRPTINITLGAGFQFRSDQYLDYIHDIHIQKNSLSVIPSREILNFKGDNIIMTHNIPGKSADIKVQSFIEGIGETGEDGLLYRDDNKLKIWIEEPDGTSGIWAIISHDQNTDYKLSDYTQQCIIKEDNTAKIEAKNINFTIGSTDSIIESYKIEKGINTAIISVYQPRGNPTLYYMAGKFTIEDIPENMLHLYVYSAELPGNEGGLTVYPNDNFMTSLGMNISIKRESDFISIKKN